MSAPVPLVIKFGGASLAEPSRVAARVRGARAETGGVVVVASARQGMTDLLSRILARPRARAEHARILHAIARAHTTDRGDPPEAIADLHASILAVERGFPGDRPLADRLLSAGERLAVRWLAAELRARELPAVAVDADQIGLTTDNSYGASVVLLDRSRRPVRSALRPMLARGEVPVVTGFFGLSLEGRVATLGRGGSDYSASALGALLDASAVELVKSGVAVQTADPRWVPTARLVPRLSYEEAEELAQFGARVLHPMTIDPARRYSVEIRVRSIEDPRMVTAIGPKPAAREVRAMTLLGPLRLLRVRFAGGRQRPGIVAEVSRRVAREGINLVALYTSSALLALVVEPGDTRATVRALRPMTGAGPAGVEPPEAVELLTVIGRNVTHDLGRLPGWVLGIAGGLSATPRSLSLAIPARRSREALRAAHRALVERAR